MVYLQTYLKVFFNLLKPFTELITNNFLSDHGCKKAVTKLKNNNSLMSCYIKAGIKLLRYLNIILDNLVFEHIFFSYKSNMNYNNDSHEILNLK